MAEMDDEDMYLKVDPYDSQDELYVYAKKLEQMSHEEFLKHLEEKEQEKQKQKLIDLEIQKEEDDELADMHRLAEKGMREAQKRERIENLVIKKYLKNNPLNKKSFISDINSYETIYVFCFGWAKLESSVYQSFLKSLTDNDFCKVYIGGPNRCLSKIVGLTRDTELKPDLRKIGTALDGDDVGVILTNKTKEEVFSKLSEYKEFDFVKPGNTPVKTVVFEKNQVLPLPIRSSAKKLFPILQCLNMPVKLIHENYVVCEERERVTENASKILKHLKMKMFNYVLVPVCGWTAATKQFEYFDVPHPTRQ